MRDRAAGVDGQHDIGAIVRDDQMIAAATGDGKRAIGSAIANARIAGRGDAVGESKPASAGCGVETGG